MNTADELKQGLAYHESGQLERAKSIYRRLLKAAPKYGEANHLLGMIAYQEGDYETAMHLVKKAIKIDPLKPHIHNNKGEIYRALKKYKSAATSYRKAIQLNPDFVDAHNNLGNILKELGDLEHAVIHYRKALELKSDCASAHNNLGVLQAEKGNLEEAVISYQNAISLEPEFYQAHHNLGILYRRLNQINAARICFERAMALIPNIEDYYQLANIAVEQGSLETAVRYLEIVLKLQPDHIGALCELGRIQTQCNAYDDAFDTFSRALEISPHHSQVHENIAKAHKQLGNFEKSIAHYRLAIHGSPESPQCYRNISSMTHYTELNDDIQAMRALLEKNETTDAQRMELYYGLAKAYEDLQRYDQSFECLQRGSRLKRKTIDYSSESTKNYFSKIRESFSEELFSSHRGSGHRDDMPIFIVGMPRSGTSLVEQILASHPHVHGAGELTDLINITNNLHSTDGVRIFPDHVAGLSSETLKKAGELYLSRLRRISNDSRYITDKMPSNFTHIGFIKLILPHAKIIHCNRHPIDNAFSIYKNYFTGTQDFSYDLSEIADYYLEYHLLMQHWNRVLPDSIYSIAYEKLVSDQENQTRKLLEFCHLPWDDACLKFYQTERRVDTASAVQVRQPIYNSSVQLWKHYQAHLQPLMRLKHLPVDRITAGSRALTSMS